MNYDELVKEIIERFNIDEQAARKIVALVIDWLNLEF